MTLYVDIAHGFLLDVQKLGDVDHVVLSYPVISDIATSGVILDNTGFDQYRDVSMMEVYLHLLLTESGVFGRYVLLSGDELREIIEVKEFRVGAI